MENFSDRLKLLKDFLNLLSQRIKEYEENQEFLRQQVISETEMFLSILKAGGPEK
jgi:archaellum biogenesis protein FlaJ (TadC family)